MGSWVGRAMLQGGGRKPGCERKGIQSEMANKRVSQDGQAGRRADSSGGEAACRQVWWRDDVTTSFPLPNGGEQVSREDHTTKARGRQISVVGTCFSEGPQLRPSLYSGGRNAWTSLKSNVSLAFQYIWESMRTPSFPPSFLLRWLPPR